jgi:1-acyl-sn-glycerol-3-phosphate acyltransferase
MAKEQLTREEVRKRYLALEKQGLFDQHVDPIDFSIVEPVGPDFHYFPVGLKEKIKHDLTAFFTKRPFIFYVNHTLLETEVVGRENLKGIKSAILTCNHVQIFDCIAVEKAVRGHYLNIVAAPFNNFSTPLGNIMRSGGMLPLPATIAGMPNFEKALAACLRKKHYVLFFPEQAEWWYYPKVRPFKDGAFHYAAKYDVPVIPCFISFAPRKKKIKDKEGMYPQRMIVHVLEPIYPPKDGSLRDKRDYLRDAAFEKTKKCYEQVYGKPLRYDED